MRIIMHVDMDAFFAAIEERERPELKGKPIVVGADPKGGRGRGVVSTANYAARKFGIKSAMPISRAWRLCPAPECAYLPVDGKLYGIVSGRVMGVIKEYVERCAEAGPPLQRRPGLPILIEQVSVDEAYVDVTFCGGYESAKHLARTIKRAIKQKERLTCSIGIGPNKLIAKIASDFEKPDGLTIVRLGKVESFLGPLLIEKLPGIGPKSAAALHKKGINTILDLRVSMPSDDDLFERAHGRDDSPVVEAHEPKSFGRETTFEHDTRNQALLTKTVLELCDEVMEEVRRKEVQFKTITVRVRFDNFETHTSAHTLPAYTRDDTILKREVLKLLFPYFKRKRLIRLIGVRVSKLERR